MPHRLHRRRHQHPAVLAGPHDDPPPASMTKPGSGYGWMGRPEEDELRMVTRVGDHDDALTTDGG